MLGQTHVSGLVLNSFTGEPLPFTNIGILNTELGTISNEDGSFALIIPEKHVEKDLLFSSVGYHQHSIKIVPNSDFTDLLINLKPQVLELRQVEITGHKTKKKSKEFGNGSSLLLSGQLHFDTLSAGSAMALLIDKSDYPELNYIQQASLYIAKNLSPEFKVRLRIMAVDSVDNTPKEDLLAAPVLLNSDKKRGWLNFELDEHLFLSHNQFFLVFEWILTKKDRKNIADAYQSFMENYPERVSYASTVVDGDTVVTPQVNRVVAGTIFGITNSKKDMSQELCYFRSNSFGTWKRASGILSAKVKLNSFPGSKKQHQKMAPCTTLQCELQTWAQDFKEKYGLPGLQLSVSVHDSLLFSEGFGYADLAIKKEVNKHTQFRIASVSKTMTAVAIMQLHEQGKINLEAPIQQYVPQFPLKKHPVTVQQLLGHLGGIKDFDEKSWDEIFIQKDYLKLNDALAIFKSAPLANTPGQHFHYSSYGYILLGAAIENITKQSFLEYMNQHIWNPLHLTGTYGDLADSVIENKSKFYLINGEESPSYNASYSYPSGGLISTSDDLVRFGRATQNNTLLAPSSRAQMLQTQSNTQGQATGYGLGWYIFKDNHNRPVYYHAGELPSTGAFIFVSPEDNITIGLLSNTPIVCSTEQELLEEVLQLKAKIRAGNREN